MKKLDVPRIKQTKNMCGPYAVKQIFDFYGCDKSISEIIKGTKANKKKGGTYFSGVLGYLQDEGLDIKFFNNALTVFDYSWKDLSGTEMAEKLTQRMNFLNKNRKVYKGFVNYFLKGGTVSFDLIGGDLFRNMLDQDMPVLVLLNSTFYNQKTRRYKGKDDDVRGKKWGHFVVVAGYDKDKFYIVDPSMHREIGQYWVDSDFLIASIHSWHPVAVAVGPKK